MTNSTQPDAQPIGACAILINSNGHILLGKRKNSYKAGFLGLPGGRIEINEPIDQAMVREVVEETDIKNFVYKFVGVVRENQGEYDFIHFIYSAEIGDQQPKIMEPDKCEGWHWLKPDSDLSEVLPGHKAAIEMWIKKQSLSDLTN